MWSDHHKFINFSDTQTVLLDFTFSNSSDMQTQKCFSTKNNSKTNNHSHKDLLYLSQRSAFNLMKKINPYSLLNRSPNYLSLHDAGGTSIVLVISPFRASSYSQNLILLYLFSIAHFSYKTALTVALRT